jgi:hypothetical protein
MHMSCGLMTVAVIAATAFGPGATTATAALLLALTAAATLLALRPAAQPMTAVAPALDDHHRLGGTRRLGGGRPGQPCTSRDIPCSG